MSYREPNTVAVKLGTNTIVGMGTFSLSGVSADQMDSSAFGSNWKTFAFGMKDGGTISFNGLADPDDTTGQIALQLANLSNTDLTNLRIYVDNTSYYEPCQTTGYFSPTNTTGFGTIASWCNISSFEISGDKSDLVKISFTAKVSGVMVLV